MKNRSMREEADPEGRQGAGDLDGPRPEVPGFQDQVPRGQAPGAGR